MNNKRFTRKGLAALIAACLILCVAIGGTVAWLTDQTATLTNTFEPGTVPPVIHEKTENRQKEEIILENAGNVNAYLRAAIVMNWVDNSGNPVYSETALPALPALGTGWQKLGTFYYYTSVVGPGEKTTPLFSGAITEPATLPAGVHLKVIVLAESIQADGTDSSGKTPVELTWGAEAAALLTGNS